MVTSPVLAMPDFTIPFIIETDASGHGVGAVLMQAKRPIAYFSKMLGPRSRLKAIYEKELIAICLAVLKWKSYLLGRHFFIYTDQQSLKYVMEQREVGANYQKWVSKLLAFDFEIKYKPGSSNRVADALSRKTDGEVVLNEMVSTTRIDWEGLFQEIERDPFLTKLKNEVNRKKENYSGFEVMEGRLLYKKRLVIPRSSSFIPIILKECHDSPVGGHSGEIKTYLRMASEWFWQGMRKDVQKHVRECTVCQQHKSSNQHPAGLLQPLPVPTQVWDHITMDFVEGLPKSKGFDTILVVVDRLSKYSHFIKLKHPFSALTVAGVFVAEVVRLHGFPTSIVSDRDRIFMSLFWRELFRLQGTSLKRSSAYHPQTDGQSEVVNKCLETYLRCFASGHPHTWAQWLSWAESWYNTSPHLSLNMTPFQVMYGREPPQLLKLGAGHTPVDSLEEELKAREAILDELKLHLLRAQQIMKDSADKKRRELTLQVGDEAYLKLQPYRQRSLARRPFEKLAARFYGPFTVLERIGEVAYKLDLPIGSKIHPVFHISQLKKAVGSNHTPAALPIQLTSDGEMLVQPEQLLAVRNR